MKRVLLCVALIVWSGMASAVVYKWVDAQGKVEYGDHPPDGVHAEIVEGLGTRATGRQVTSTVAAKAASTVTRSSSTTPTPAVDPAKQAVDQDVAQTRDKQCSDAQNRYKTLIEGRRLYKPGADGERQYLTSEEIDAERVNAKKELDTICNSPT